MQKLVEGFTREEADFMDEVPGFLSSGMTMFDIAAEYNDKFNTRISTRHFHDRFDDYMKELAKDDSEDVSQKEDSPEDILKQYFKEYDGSNVDKMMAYCSWPILIHYERWRQKKNLQNLENYLSMMDLVNSLMNQYDVMVNSINRIFQ